MIERINNQPPGLPDLSNFKKTFAKELQETFSRLSGTPGFLRDKTGKQTDLSVTEWLAARTESFKREHGEWEEAALDQAILKSGINENTINLINTEINEKTDRLHFTIPLRGAQTYATGTAGINRLHEGASIICRAGSGTDTQESPDEFKKFRNRQQIELPLLKSWAKNNNAWTDNIEDKFRKLKRIGTDEEGNDIGGEASVWLSDDNEYVIKAITLDYYVDPIQALNRIDIHNLLFPTTKLETTGYGTDEEGNFRIIVKQKFIQGTNPTQEQIQEFVKSLNIKACPRYGPTSYCNELFIISDLHDENIIVDRNGRMHLIDAELRYNTPGMGIGGKLTYPERSKIELNETLEPSQRIIKEFLKSKERTLKKERTPEHADTKGPRR